VRRCETASPPHGAAELSAYPERRTSSSRCWSYTRPRLRARTVVIQCLWRLGAVCFRIFAVSVKLVPIFLRMPQSLAEIIVHAVFSTKDRRPLLKAPAIRQEMHRYLGGILGNLDCQPIIVGGVEDHVHLLCTLSRTCKLSDMVKEVKRGSSLWIKERDPRMGDFAWQAGYGIFSIGFSQIEAVRNYIASQEEHHRKHSFQDEFRSLLKRYGVEYDERYVWE
jgi:putative transposase